MVQDISTKNTFRDVLVSLGGNYKNLVVLTADMGAMVGTDFFKKQFSERYWNMGMGESNMFGVAASMSIRGKIPFVCTLSIIATGHGWEQIRSSVCSSHLNVKIIGAYAGLMSGKSGASFQALSDIALMRALPNMKVLCPADFRETVSMLDVVVNDFGPTYIRLGSEIVPRLYDDTYTFAFGKGNVLRSGRDVVIFAVGSVVCEALDAARMLEHSGISVKVVNMSCLKPLDDALVIESAKNVSHVVTVEDHSIIGGLGSAVMEVLSEHYPCKVCRIGVRDQFGESGSKEDLYKKYGLDARGIYEQVKRFVSSSTG